MDNPPLQTHDTNIIVRGTSYGVELTSQQVSWQLPADAAWKLISHLIDAIRKHKDIVADANDSD